MSQRKASFSIEISPSLVLTKENYSDYLRQLSSFVRKRYGQYLNDADIQEVANDIMFKAWHDRDRYSGNQSFEGWLHGIAKHTAIDAIRRRHTKTLKIMRQSIDGLEFSGNTDVESQADAERLLESIANDQSPLAQTFMATHYVGYSQSEYARLTGLPLGTVKARDARTISRLREQHQIEIEIPSLSAE